MIRARLLVVIRRGLDVLDAAAVRLLAERHPAIVVEPAQTVADDLQARLTETDAKRARAESTIARLSRQIAEDRAVMAAYAARDRGLEMQLN